MLKMGQQLLQGRRERPIRRCCSLISVLRGQQQPWGHCPEELHHLRSKPCREDWTGSCTRFGGEGERSKWRRDVSTRCNLFWLTQGRNWRRFEYLPNIHSFLLCRSRRVSVGGLCLVTNNSSILKRAGSRCRCPLSTWIESRWYRLSVLFAT